MTTSKTANRELAAKAIARIHECYDKARARFPSFRLPYPSIEFTSRGRRAGSAYTMSNRIKLNPVLLNENGDDFISRTPGHEAAHIIANNVFGKSGHGPNWKLVMRFLGQDPSRCHSFDTTNTEIVKRRAARVPYICLACNGELTMAQKCHNKVLRGYVYTHRCVYKGRIVPKASAPAVIRAPTPVRTPPPVIRPISTMLRPINITPAPMPTASSGKTKMQLAHEVFKAHPNHTRANLIKLMVAYCKLTPAGASTYYSKLRSMY